MYGQALYPADQQNVFYAYQGITNDGKYYVSAIFPIANHQLPLDGSSTIDDWNAFYDHYETYLWQVTDMLNNAAPDQFTPNMQALDALLASLQVKP